MSAGSFVTQSVNTCTWRGMTKLDANRLAAPIKTHCFFVFTADLQYAIFHIYISPIVPQRIGDLVVFIKTLSSIMRKFQEIFEPCQIQ